MLNHHRPIQTPHLNLTITPEINAMTLDRHAWLLIDSNHFHPIQIDAAFVRAERPANIQSHRFFGKTDI